MAVADAALAAPDETSGPAISVRHVSKWSRPKVQLGRRDGESLRRVWRQVLGKPAVAAGVASVANAERPVLQDVSLDIGEGTVVALKGLSGSGKSEFLQVLAGVLPIDEGEVRIRGEIGSLLQRGDGLAPELSLREIVTRGDRPGAVGNEEKYREIVDFSGLKKFQDVPVRTLSTGMKMRLSVAITLLSPADVLLLDDVFEVGDIGFQNRIAARLAELTRGRTTVLISSRDDLFIESIADRVLTFDGGRIVEDRRAGIAPIAGPAAPDDEPVCVLAPTLPDNAFIELESASKELTGGERGASLKIVFEVRARTDHVLRPLIDLRRHLVACARSISPGSVEMREGEGHAFSVEVPLWMFRVDAVSIDLSFLVAEGGRYHSVKSRDFATVRLPNEWEEGGAIFDPDLEWVGGEVNA